MQLGTTCKTDLVSTDTAGLLCWDSIYQKPGQVFFFFEKKFNLTDGFFIRKDKQIDLNAEVIIGAILFGIGWSISGLCVSTATVNLAFGHSQSTLFFLFMIIGFYCPQFFKKITKHKAKVLKILALCKLFLGSNYIAFAQSTSTFSIINDEL